MQAMAGVQGVCNIVRELFGVMAAQGATGGFVVTSGVFTADAHEFAKGRNIDLIDGAALKVMIERARAARSVVAPVSKPAAQTYTPAPAQANEPACPRCGGAMIKRIAKQGANAGGSFWGCSGYPACRGIRAID